MKKGVLLVGLLLVLAFVFLLYSSHLAIAQTPEEIIQQQTGINPDINKIPQTPEDAKQLSQDYLKKEWIKLFENNTLVLSPMIKFYRQYPYIGSTIKTIIGVPPGLNWLFFMTLTLWVTFAIYIFRTFSAVSPFSKGVSTIISLTLIIATGIIGIVKAISTKIISVLSLMNTWWMQLIGVVAIWVLIILASIYSKQFEALMKKAKENMRKAREERRLSRLEFKQKMDEESNKIVRDILTKT
jgi:hypothetical protein